MLSILIGVAIAIVLFSTKRYLKKTRGEKVFRSFDLCVDISLLLLVLAVMTIDMQLLWFWLLLVICLTSDICDNINWFMETREREYWEKKNKKE